jgi:hypothetical protein
MPTDALRPASPSPNFVTESRNLETTRDNETFRYDTDYSLNGKVIIQATICT